MTEKHAAGSDGLYQKVIVPMNTFIPILRWENREQAESRFIGRVVSCVYTVFRSLGKRDSDEYCEFGIVERFNFLNF